MFKEKNILLIIMNDPFDYFFPADSNRLRFPDNAPNRLMIPYAPNTLRNAVQNHLQRFNVPFDYSQPNFWGNSSLIGWLEPDLEPEPISPPPSVKPENFSEDFIKTLTISDYKDECPICYETEYLFYLPCKHGACYQCLKKIEPKCFICRRKYY